MASDEDEEYLLSDLDEEAFLQQAYGTDEEAYLQGATTGARRYRQLVDWVGMRPGLQAVAGWCPRVLGGREPTHPPATNSLPCRS